MVRYDQLDDDQKRFVDNDIKNEGNIWIQGYAGSGKSILLVHALRSLLKENPRLNVCIVVYTRALVEMFKAGLNEIDRNDNTNLANIPIYTNSEFSRSIGHYDYIFCDEVQDLTQENLTEMRIRSDHLHVAGDSNQSIYDNSISPNLIGDTINARPITLRKIYRLSRSIINAVTKLFPNGDIFTATTDETKGDVLIRLAACSDKEDEVRFVWSKSKESASEGYSSAILLPLHSEINSFVQSVLKVEDKPSWEIVKNRFNRPDYWSLNHHLRENNVKLQLIGNGYGSFQDAEQNNEVILMTYHSSKGMDFTNVFLPFLSSSTNIPGNKSDVLFMVALTRSRKNVYISYSDYLHDFVQKIRENCVEIDTRQNTGNIGKNDSFNLGF